MITARSSSGVPRIRGNRNPLVLLWLALLLVGVLDAHGIAAGSGYGHHASPASVTAASAQTLLAGADGSTHPAEHCVPGRSDRGTAPGSHPQMVAGPATPALRTDAPPAPGTVPRTYGAPPPPAHGVLRI
ncbi:hypothetical protein ACIRUY_24570 [Streptomyces erythrochromogenes]|uniref:hypothetical protein n=1 Tax=Streptomyces erythrochromogenes TaxID=285574 RepID=UPI0038163DC5